MTYGKLIFYGQIIFRRAVPQQHFVDPKELLGQFANCMALNPLHVKSFQLTEGATASPESEICIPNCPALPSKYGKEEADMLLIIS